MHYSLNSNIYIKSTLFISYNQKYQRVLSSPPFTPPLKIFLLVFMNAPFLLPRTIFDPFIPTSAKYIQKYINTHKKILSKILRIYRQNGFDSNAFFSFHNWTPFCVSLLIPIDRVNWDDEIYHWYNADRGLIPHESN